MKVLICEDTDFLRSVLKGIMVKAGHTVVAEAATGEDALELYSQTNPDICFLDISLPGIDGITVLKNIKSLNPDAKCIMCTGMGDQMSMLSCIQSGAIDYISKPFDEGRVLEAIAKA